MKCPYLFGTRILACSADKEVYVPSLLELQGYCEMDSYRLCSHFPERAIESGKSISDSTKAFQRTELKFS